MNEESANKTNEKLEKLRQLYRQAQTNLDREIIKARAELLKRALEKHEENKTINDQINEFDKAFND